MKLAVGLFHFNVQYVAGQTDLYHRYCTEAIGPFLEAVDRRKNWRTSFEIAGNGLEFLDKHYPAMVKLLRRLTEDGRIELVSSMYVPSIWPAFPARDLIKSIELNRECLRSLGLPATRIFFAHEGFFGLGACALTDYFDVAICKDDYLRHYCQPEDVCPAYRSGNMLVLTGSNHIVNELYRKFVCTGRKNRELLPAHQERLEEVAQIVARSGSASGSCAGIDWRWYHLGSGHNLGTWRRPEDGDEFFFDPDWAHLVDELLDSYTADGYQFATAGDLSRAIGDHVTAPLPPLIEGSWDSEGSEGIFAWMGRHQNIWEDDPGILGLSWRARGRLVEYQRSLDGNQDAESQRELNGSFTELWKSQILAESSDSLGWAPRPKEVDFVKEAARRVLSGIDEIANKLNAVPRMAPGADTVYRQPARQSAPFICPELFGAEGTISILSPEANLQVAETWFRPTGNCFGVHFQAFPSALVYCPSGREEDPVRIPWDDLIPPVLYLALANGLIAVSDDVYLIRENAFGQVAACADKRARHISFMVRGMSRVKYYRWRFFLFRGSLNEAVDRANRINFI